MTEHASDYTVTVTELVRERGPLCPLDLPQEVWDAVSQHYDGDPEWAPGPNYHPEYRDARSASIATSRYYGAALHEARNIARIALSVLRDQPTDIADIDERLADLPEWTEHPVHDYIESVET